MRGSNVPPRHSWPARAAWRGSLPLALVALWIAAPAIATGQTQAGSPGAGGSVDYFDFTFSNGRAAIGIGGLILGMLVAVFGRDLVLRAGTARARKTRAQWDDRATTAAARIVFWGGLLAGVVAFVYVATEYFTQGHAHIVDNVMWAVLYVYLLFVAYEAIDVLGTVLGDWAGRTRSHLDDRLARITKRILQAVVVAVGVVLIVRLVEAPLEGVLLGIGLALVMTLVLAWDAVRGVGYALELTIDSAFRDGDVIRVETPDGRVVEGAVIASGVRAVQLLTAAHTPVWLPNRVVASASIENLSLRGARRFEMDLSLARGSIELGEVPKLVSRIRERLADREEIVIERAAEDPQSGAILRGPAGDPVRVGADPRVAVGRIDGAEILVEVRFDVSAVDPKRAAQLRQDLWLDLASIVEAFGAALTTPAGRVAIEGLAPAAAGSASRGTSPTARSATKKKTTRRKSATKKKATAATTE